MSPSVCLAAAGVSSSAASFLSEFSELAAQVVLSWIGQALLFGTLLAVVTWALLSTALRRARPALHAAFWLVVIAKFLLPVGPGWNFSLASLAASAAPWLTSVSPASAVMTATPAAKPRATTILYWLAEPVISESAQAANSSVAPAAAARSMNLSTWLAIAYFAGLLLVLAVRLGRYWQFAAAVKRLPHAAEATQALVAEVSNRLKLRRFPDVRISDAAPAPYVLGALRPTLVLSNENLRRSDECEAVILHELAHLRRHDLLVRYAQWLAGTLLYFWPVVAWVNRRIDLAREAACDEWALRHGRLSPAEYARCLLKCMRTRRFALIPYAPAAMAANAAHVERRIEMILNSPNSLRRNRMTMLLGGAALCGWTGFVMSGANAAALPSAKPVDDVHKTCPAPWWTSQNDALAFFLPDVADSIADDDEVVTDGFWMTAGGDAMSLSLSPQIIQQHLFLHPEMTDGQQHSAVFMVAGHDVFGPQAGVDADGDGAVSMDEHMAYLVALAMRDPAATLAKYPKADTNGDGSLSADEAADLLHADLGPGPGAIALSLPDGVARDGHGAHTFNIALTPENAAAASAHIARITAGNVASALKDCEGNGTIEVEVATGVDGQPKEHVIVMKGADGGAWVTSPDADSPASVQKRVMVFRTADASSASGAHAITLQGDDANAEGGNAVRKLKTVKMTIEGGVVTTETTEQDGDGEPRVTVTRKPADQADAPVAIALAAPDAAAKVPVLGGIPVIGSLFKADANVQFEEPAAVWLMANAPHGDNAVSAADVRKYTATAADADLKRFLRRHPKADTNKDGVLTVAERDAYQAKMQTRRQKKMLEKFPQADKDHNGSLTDEEIREFFKNRISEKAGVDGATDEQVVTTPDGKTMRVITTNAGDGSNKNVEVKVVTTPEAKDGPR